jgi:hypothetical protein
MYRGRLASQGSVVQKGYCDFFPLLIYRFKIGEENCWELYLGKQLLSRFKFVAKKISQKGVVEW